MQELLSGPTLFWSHHLHTLGNIRSFDSGAWGPEDVRKASLSQNYRENIPTPRSTCVRVVRDLLFFQLAPKFHTKGCSHSSADSVGARNTGFCSIWAVSGCGISGVNSANTRLCDTFGALPQFCFNNPSGLALTHIKKCYISCSYASLWRRTLNSVTKPVNRQAVL